MVSTGWRTWPVNRGEARRFKGEASVRETETVRRVAIQAEAVPAAVDLTLRGSRDALRIVGADEVVAFIDLAGLGPGEYVLTIHADSPADTGVTDVSPESVKVRITSGKP